MEKALPNLLRICGALTCGAALLFLAPTPVLKLLGMPVEGDTALFFVRHWGLLVACLGGLLFYAANRPALQVPAMMAATLEKLAFVLMVAMTPAVSALLPAAFMDAGCVLLFSAVLWKRL